VSDASNAVSVRGHGDTSARSSGQSDHDLREGLVLDADGRPILEEGADRADAERRLKLIPNYVDKTRCHLNSVLVPTMRGPALRAICEERRAQRETKRAMKSNAAVSTSIIITFGKGVQDRIEALPAEVQDQAFREVMEKIAAELNNTVSGLVVHRDETAIHAHGQMPGYNLDGTPNSKVMNPEFHRNMQDWAAEIWQRYEPTVVRGKPKSERIARGDDAAQIFNRSVKELHADLPAEIDAKRAELADVQADLDKQAKRLTKAHADLEKAISESGAESAKADKARKRASTYEKRAEKAQSEVDRLTKEIDGKQAALDQIEKATITARNDLDQVETQIAEAEAALIAKQGELDGLESAVAQKKTTIASLRERKATLQARLQSLNAS
jgi:predicted  nucleic acid-binding Zn-ribbon protein